MGSWSYIKNPSGGGYNPLTDISSIALWLDPSDGSSVTAAAGVMTQWRDKSGNANHAVPAVLTGANAPAYPGTTLNSLNTMAFTRSTLTGAVLGTVSVQPSYTILFVARLTNNPPVNSCLLSNDNGQIWNMQGGVNEIYDNAHFLDVNESHVSGTTYFYALTSDGTISGTKFYRNNTALTVNTSSGTTFTSANIALKYIGIASNGAGSALYGTDVLFGDILVYGAVANSTQLTDAYTYYRAKWGI